jgi:heme/copper-type cytochrome/quinol oxidase subunit 3
MAQAPVIPVGTHADSGQPLHITPASLEAHPVTPGKVAMWLFLATEIMFFTGLIGSYIVLRSGSPPTGYSELYAPATDLTQLMDRRGVVLTSLGPNPEKVAEIFHARNPELTETQLHHALEWIPHVVQANLSEAQAKQLAAELAAAGATAEVKGLEGNTHAWPRPYDPLTNPLSIDLTALNTFILICSSVTMVLALSAIQRGNKPKLLLFLGATILIGSVFLSIQVYEYAQLMFVHHYPPGISPTGHFRPNVSLFASCFFTMTGFHGAHVLGGIILLSVIWLNAAITGCYTRQRHSPVELAGLYWHFVDLVWIILFTVVYLI